MAATLGGVGRGGAPAGNAAAAGGDTRGVTSVLPVSPLLDLPGAVPGSGVDASVALHYGDPVAEQRALARRAGWVDRGNRTVVTVPGADRLSWLHSITSQHLSGLADGQGTEALVLSPHGHVEHHLMVAEQGGVTWLDGEPGTGADLLAYLDSMRFLLRVEPADVTADWAVLSLVGPETAAVLQAADLPVPSPPYGVAASPLGGIVRRVPSGGADLLVPRTSLRDAADRLTAAGATPAGTWAYEAIRVEARRPRLGFETDHRTIPHEIGWIGVAVHLDKGCYRGQETVARVHNLGKPPRRLVLLHLSGESEQLPAPLTPVRLAGRAVGFVGTAVRHHELGPVALALVKRTTAADAELSVDGVPAAIDPD
jgi:tRNA-modifying protein YgfZ